MTVTVVGYGTDKVTVEPTGISVITVGVLGAVAVEVV